MKENTICRKKILCSHKPLQDLHLHCYISLYSAHSTLITGLYIIMPQSITNAQVTGEPLCSLNIN